MDHPSTLIEKGKLYDEAIETLKITLNALKDVCRQIPNDETLADYSFDLAEIAQASAIKTLKKSDEL